MKLFSFSNSLQVYFHSISAGFHQKKKKNYKKNLWLLPQMGTIQFGHLAKKNGYHFCQLSRPYIMNRS